MSGLETGRRRRRLSMLAAAALIGAVGILLGWWLSGGRVSEDGGTGPSGPGAQESPAYPTGAFALCPKLSAVLPADPGAHEEAEAVALEVDRALASGETGGLSPLLDPSIRGNRAATLSGTGSAQGLRVSDSRPASGDGLVTAGCGPEVAERSWAVTIHDGSGSESAGSATFYLVRRRSGWAVWGSY